MLQPELCKSWGLQVKPWEFYQQGWSKTSPIGLLGSSKFSELTPPRRTFHADSSHLFSAAFSANKSQESPTLDLMYVRGLTANSYLLWSWGQVAFAILQGFHETLGDHALFLPG